ncbi:MAG: hypothetical protein EOM25_14040 [Deltaproteobacteria bacterium]|nr:hypothetical protein [Deltaproteobacteria bacterium]
MDRDWTYLAEQRVDVVGLQADLRDGLVTLLADRDQPVPVAEMALLVISPAHRGRKLMERFLNCLKERARKMGIFGLSFNPVTSHPVSVRNTIALGALPCGLDLAACPPRNFKSMDLGTAPPQRESYLHCFQYLVDPPPAKVCDLGRHRAIVERVLGNLDRTIISPPEETDHGPGEYAVVFDRGLLKGVVRVSRADERQWPEIRRAALDLLDIAGAEVVHIDLPLAQPATAVLAEQVKEAGFFFAGVWPHAAEDGDMLRFTRLAVPLDMNRLRLHSDLAHDLGRYVGEEMARVSALPA